MADEKKFFTRPRREFIARAMMDVVKLLFVAGVVGGFFLSAVMPLRIGGVVILVFGFAISVAILPSKKET